MTSDYIYVDHAATTRMRTEVVAAMVPYFTEFFGNSGSNHQLGVLSNKAVNQARRSIAGLIGGSTDGIYFTSGASEANNWAISGICHANCDKGKHIITTRIEHPSVQKACERLATEGFEITYLDVDGTGRLLPEQVEKAIRPDTILVSVMYANNEVGTIQPIREIGAICRQQKVLFHVDAVQAFGKIPISVSRDMIDLLTISGHKIYGPKGIGCLYVRDYIKIEPLILGGEQQDGYRSGTLPVPEIVGFQIACECILQEMEQESLRLEQIRRILKEALQSNFESLVFNENETHHIANILNVSFEGVEAEKILIHLDRKQIYAAGGSACSSRTHKPSRTLQAMGRRENEMKGTIRFSFGRENQFEDVDRIIETLLSCECLQGLRKHSEEERNQDEKNIS